MTQQVSAPVEWMSQLETMYDAGARVFIECGPKKVLCGLVASLFKSKPHYVFSTNSHKEGGWNSFYQNLAGIQALSALSLPNTGSDTRQTQVPPPDTNSYISTEAPISRVEIEQMLDQRFSRLIETLSKHTPTVTPTPDQTSNLLQSRPHHAIEVVCSGAAVGLPGGESVFSDRNIEALLSGENRIGMLSTEQQKGFLKKGSKHDSKKGSKKGSENNVLSNVCTDFP